MTPTAEALARKLADHPRFRWLRGTRGLRWAPGHRDHLRGEFSSDGESDDRPKLFGSVPDLDDAATVGCIEAQAREFMQDLRLYPPEDPGDPWDINYGIMDSLCDGATRGEAWASAFLELAI